MGVASCVCVRPILMRRWKAGLSTWRLSAWCRRSSPVAASSFVGTSLFAMTGLVLGELGVGVGELLLVIGLAVVWAVVLTPFVLPPLMAMFRRLEPARLA